MAEVDDSAVVRFSDVGPIGSGYFKALRKLLPTWTAPLVERIEALENRSADKLQDKTRQMVKSMLTRMNAEQMRVKALEQRIAELDAEAAARKQRRQK